MKNLENAIMIRSDPEPVNAQIADILIYCIVTDMMDTAWNVLQNGYESTVSMVKMKQQYSIRCKEASRILHFSGTGDHMVWAIQPVFADDYPISDVTIPEELPVSFPVGVEYHGTVYSYDIEAYFSMPHCDYLPSVRKMYAEKIAHLQPDDFHLNIFTNWQDDNSD